jgi:hypothetical protein
MKDHSWMKVGTITNYYGGLLVKVEGGKAYWSIDSHKDTEWEQIPESLHKELMKFKEKS